MGAIRNLSRTLMLLAAVLLLAASAQATPLNLQAGDVIDTIEWDAFRANGDSGDFTAATGELFTNGQITSVEVERAPAFPPTLTVLPQAGVTFTFAVELIGGSLNGTDLLTLWSGSNLTDPDVSVYQNGNLILTGDFLGNFGFGGSIFAPALTSRGTIRVTGGDSTLVAAIGNQAELELRATVDNFIPSLLDLLSDNLVGNEDFSVEFSGTLLPANPTPFVPEPGTMALLGVGLLGLLAVGRRRSR